MLVASGGKRSSPQLDCDSTPLTYLYLFRMQMQIDTNVNVHVCIYIYMPWNKCVYMKFEKNTDVAFICIYRF